MIQLNDHFNVAGSHPTHSIPRQHEMLINGKQMQRQQVNHIVNTIKTQTFNLTIGQLVIR